MKAYLEKMNGEWMDDFVYISRYHLIEMGFEIVPFDGDFELHKLDNATLDDVCIGSVQVTTYFFKVLGIEVPGYLGFPSSLKPYYGRNISRNTIGSLPKDYPFFMKPANDIKLFTGEVIESEKSIEFFMKYCAGDMDDNTEVYVSDVVDMESEYRCFVFNGELKGIQYYKGDFTKYPNPQIIKEMIKDYKGSPIAYTLDVARVGEDTVVVEVNDMWSIGSYGFDSKTYTLMCVRRMREIQGKLK